MLYSRCFLHIASSTREKKQRRYFPRQKENNLELIYRTEVYETAVKS